jgi:hypothetical protein
MSVEIAYAFDPSPLERPRGSGTEDGDEMGWAGMELFIQDIEPVNDERPEAAAAPVAELQLPASVR